MLALLVLFYMVSISFIPMRYHTKMNLLLQGRGIMKFLIGSYHDNDPFYLIDVPNHLF